MDLKKLREITEKLNRSDLLKGMAYKVLDTFINQQEEALLINGVINCTTCAFNDEKYIKEICSYCDRYFNKHKPK